MELDPQVSPEEIMNREVELSCELDFFRFELFLSSSATDIVLVTLPSTAVETAVARCTSRWAMARGHRLNTSIVLAAAHSLSSLFRVCVCVCVCACVRACVRACEGWGCVYVRVCRRFSQLLHAVIELGTMEM